jgi:hypothetical protein
MRASEVVALVGADADRGLSEEDAVAWLGSAG